MGFPACSGGLLIVYLFFFKIKGLSIVILCSHQDRIINSLMRYLLIIFFLSLQANAEEVWKPFGIELGKELPNSLEVTNFDAQCFAHTLQQKDIKLKCYQVKVNHSLFANFTYVAINNDETLSNYNIGDVLAVDVWKTNTNKSS